MRALRLLLACLSASVALAVVGVVAFAAPAAVSAAASPSAGAAAAQYCPPGVLAQRKALVKRYLKQMPAARKAYFRRTKSAKARKAFVKKQLAQLKVLQRAVQNCD